MHAKLVIFLLVATSGVFAADDSVEEENGYFFDGVYCEKSDFDFYTKTTREEFKEQCDHGFGADKSSKEKYALAQKIMCAFKHQVFLMTSLVTPEVEKLDDVIFHSMKTITSGPKKEALAMLRVSPNTNLKKHLVQETIENSGIFFSGFPWVTDAEPRDPTPKADRLTKSQSKEVITKICNFMAREFEGIGVCVDKIDEYMRTPTATLHVSGDSLRTLISVSNFCQIYSVHQVD